MLSTKKLGKTLYQASAQHAAPELKIASSCFKEAKSGKYN